MLTKSIFTQYKYFGIIYISTGLIILILNELLKYNHNGHLHKLIHACFYMNESKFSEALTCSRGKNYYTISDTKMPVTIKEEKENDKKHKFCLMPLWAIAHVVMYIFIGYLCPDLFVQSFLLGVVWEYAEYKVFHCHDILDILFNTIGFGIGYALKKVAPNYNL